MLFAKDGQQRGDIVTHTAMRLAQQGAHGHPFIDEEADVALWLSTREGVFQSAESPHAVAPRLQSQRTQHENFERTPQACFRFGIPQEAIQQAQNILQERTSQVIASLSNAHACQGQVLLLTRIAQVLIGEGQAAAISPVKSCRQVGLRQLYLCSYCPSSCQQLWHEVPLARQVRKGVQGRQRAAVLATCLLQASQGDGAQ